MSNIEIWGFWSLSAVQLVEFRQRIKDILEKESYADEIAISPVLSWSHTLTGEPIPFLRVWDTQEIRGQKVTNILRMNGFRVERPVVLEQYVEPPMWSEKEIAEDLQWILETDWLKSRVSGTSMSRAIENLQHHEYAEVAEFYLHVARGLRSMIGSRGDPPTSEIGEWVISATKEVCHDVRDPKGRLIMLIQIIFSLMPHWNILTIFPAD